MINAYRGLCHLVAFGALSCQTEACGVIAFNFYRIGKDGLKALTNWTIEEAIFRCPAMWPAHQCHELAEFIAREELRAFGINRLKACVQPIGNCAAADVKQPTDFIT